MPNDRVRVDSEALARTGDMAKAASAAVDGLRLQALRIVTSDTAKNAFGNDTMGRQLGAKYGPASDAFIEALVNVQDAFQVMGDRLTGMARNYDNTEAMNTKLSEKFAGNLGDSGGTSNGGSKGPKRH